MLINQFAELHLTFKQSKSSPCIVQLQQFSTAENLGNSWKQNWSGGVITKFRLLIALAELYRLILLIQ